MPLPLICHFATWRENCFNLKVSFENSFCLPARPGTLLTNSALEYDSNLNQVTDVFQVKEFLEIVYTVVTDDCLDLKGKPPAANTSGETKRQSLWANQK